MHKKIHKSISIAKTEREYDQTYRRGTNFVLELWKTSE